MGGEEQGAVSALVRRRSRHPSLPEIESEPPRPRRVAHAHRQPERGEPDTRGEAALRVLLRKPFAGGSGRCVRPLRIERRDSLGVNPVRPRGARVCSAPFLDQVEGRPEPGGVAEPADQFVVLPFGERRRCGSRQPPGLGARRDEHGSGPVAELSLAQGRQRRFDVIPGFEHPGQTEPCPICERAVGLAAEHLPVVVRGPIMRAGRGVCIGHPQEKVEVASRVGTEQRLQKRRCGLRLAPGREAVDDGTTSERPYGDLAIAAGLPRGLSLRRASGIGDRRRPEQERLDRRRLAGWNLSFQGRERLGRPAVTPECRRGRIGRARDLQILVARCCADAANCADHDRDDHERRHGDGTDPRHRCPPSRCPAGAARPGRPEPEQRTTRRCDPARPHRRSGRGRRR